MRDIHVNRLRLWSSIHKWTSLVGTVFLLILCLSGLPLIFDAEISDWLDPPDTAGVSQGSPAPTLDAIVAAALAKYPGDVAVSLGFVKERPAVLVQTAATLKTPFNQSHRQTFDLRSGAPSAMQAQGRGRW